LQHSWRSPTRDAWAASKLNPKCGENPFWNGRQVKNHQPAAMGLSLLNKPVSSSDESDKSGASGSTLTGWW
jgi:hypothetical protein